MMTGEGLRGVPCVVDKYIGDAMMVVFSDQFGSDDHLVDALTAARRFAENDFLDLHPHMGLARGRVAVGYIGTERRLQCSVFGLPVTLAARCAPNPIRTDHSASIVFPADLWRPEFMRDLFGPAEDVHVITGERSLGLPMWRRLRRRHGGIIPRRRGCHPARQARVEGIPADDRAGRQFDPDVHRVGGGADAEEAGERRQYRRFLTPTPEPLKPEAASG